MFSFSLFMVYLGARFEKEWLLNAHHYSVFEFIAEQRNCKLEELDPVVWNVDEVSAFVAHRC